MLFPPRRIIIMKRLSAIAALCLAAALSCSHAPVKSIGSPVRFAVISGTAPESPYTPYPDDLSKLIAALNRENPAIVLHLGNIIYAGNAQGLREEDVTRQIAARPAFFDKLNPVCEYTVGELDRFGGSLDFFEKATGKPAFHSFSYGPVFFLSIDSDDAGSASISKTQEKRIAQELERNADKAAIVILSYRPFFLRKELTGYLTTVTGAERFHSLFAKHRVRAVISAAGEIVSRTDRDGIAYINAGCAPTYRRDVYDRFSYHMIDITNDAVTVTGRKL